MKVLEFEKCFKLKSIYYFYQLVLVTTRCSNDKNVCEEFNELVINDVCGKLLNGGYAIIEELLTKFTPRMSCPMQPVGQIIIQQISEFIDLHVNLPGQILLDKWNNRLGNGC